MASDFPIHIDSFDTAVNNLRLDLSDDVLVDDDVIKVTSTAGAPDSGQFGIENEQIRYTGKTATQFTGCIRGADGTTAAPHLKTAEGGEVFFGPAANYVNKLADAVKAAQEKIGIDNSEDPDSHDYKISELITIIEKGWIPADETWTYASSTTFTISGDKTGKYQKGDKIRYKQGGDWKYGYIIGVSYSSPNTTITVTGGSDYSLADAAITDNYYSKVENPQGFPQWFNWTPTYNALGDMTYTSVTTEIAKLRVDKATITLIVFAEGTTGGTASSGISVSLPVNSTERWIGTGAICVDSSYMSGFAVISSGLVNVQVYKYDQSNWGLGTLRRIGFQIIYPY